MKNLKKVISTLLALAIVMSSFVAMSVSAATFKDVADTEDYAEAVNALAALGAINGYEDGTFLPDNNITRAEAITMIVGALNMTADAQKSGSVSTFTDVNANAKWAAGYVNVGVAQGFISGISKTEFAPTKNVTYAEMLSMLTRLLGYGNYANAVLKAEREVDAKAAWYVGFMEAAKVAGIQEGVTPAATADVTRAQVAQLIWNTLQAPKLGVTTVAGKLENMLSEKLDGKENDFQTLLSEKFNAYVLEAEVVGTAKNGTNELGTIAMELTKTSDWDPEEEDFVKESIKNNREVKDEVAVGKTNAEEYPFASAKVIAEFVNDEWTLLYFAPTGKIATKEVDGTLVNDIVADGENFVLKINKSKISTTTTDYKISAGAKLYVNGVEECTVEAKNFDWIKTLMADSVGATVLYEDVDATGRAYDKIMVDVYALASVSQVVDKNGTVTVKFGAVSGVGKFGSELKVTEDEIADGEKVVTVTKAGEAIELSALAKKDVVAIRHNIKGKFSDSAFVEIIATSDTITGKYSQFDDDEDLYTVDGTAYEAAFDLTSDVKAGETYTFRLDPFGRLYDSEFEDSAKLFAIVEKYVDVSEVVNASSEYDYLTVVTLDGQAKTLYVDSSTTAMKAVADAMKAAGITSSQTKNAQIDMEKRVIEYKVKASTGRISSVDFAWDADSKLSNVFTLAKDTEYKADLDRLGKTISSNAVVLDASKYDKDAPATSDYKASSLSNLVDGSEYNGFLVYENSNGEYGYVVLTKTGNDYGATSNFAVAAVTASTGSTTLHDDEEVYTLRVLDADTEDEPESIMIDPNAIVYGSVSGAYNKVAPNAIKAGAAFFYTVNSYGLVDRIDVVFDGGYTFGEKDTAPATLTVRKPEYNETTGVTTIKDSDWFLTDDESMATADEAIQLFVAPVFSANESTVKFTKYVDDTRDYLDTSVINGYTISSDANLYYYDMSEDAPISWRAFSTGFFGEGLEKKEIVDEKAYLEGPEGTFVHEAQWAFVMVVDGVVTNALILSK